MEFILASKSPRRQELIKGLELSYRVFTYEVDESFSATLKGAEIPEFLAQKKALAYPEKINSNEVLLTADTIVWVDNRVLNKPESEEEAFWMLKLLCGNKHQVFTGVCIRTSSELHVFSDCTEVACAELTDEEIYHYIRTYKPFDKAGSYGVQDWFGYAAVKGIKGCFYNVMGLPVYRLRNELKSLGFITI